jgi:hypothetical protein
MDGIPSQPGVSDRRIPHDGNNDGRLVLGWANCPGNERQEGEPGRDGMLVDVAQRPLCNAGLMFGVYP